MRIPGRIVGVRSTEQSVGIIDYIIVRKNRKTLMKKIGIIGAMELEVETLKAHMTTTKITTKAHMEFHEGTLNGTPVVIVRSGVGKVNAALCVQILADLFGVTAIINTGVAGSLNAALDIGDILISRDALHHDVDATIFGYKPGEVPQLGCREFIADEHLAQVAVSTCKEVNPDIHVHTGRVVSGDQFISSKEVKNHLIEEFNGSCVTVIYSLCRLYGRLHHFFSDFGRDCRRRAFLDELLVLSLD